VERILKDINTVVGVVGCFVCDNNGQVLATDMPELFDESILSSVGRIITQTLAGLAIARRRRIAEIDLIYDQTRFVAKNLGEACLCILCTRNVNVPLLNLNAKVATRKLLSVLKTQEQPK
jgi:predicted regulator of Ras-like GTPase activity (Roadblock/LC7/MglB family)